MLLLYLELVVELHKVVNTHDETLQKKDNPSNGDIFDGDTQLTRWYVYVVCSVRLGPRWSIGETFFALTQHNLKPTPRSKVLITLE